MSRIAVGKRLSKHNIGDLVYCRTFGLGWITKIINTKDPSKPFYVEWQEPTPEYLKFLEFYPECTIELMKEALNDRLRGYEHQLSR